MKADKMTSSKAKMKQVDKEIEAAAIALGFPRRVSAAKVETEARRLQQELKLKKSLLKPGKGGTDGWRW